MSDVRDARIESERVDGLAHTFRVALDGARVSRAVDEQLEQIGRTARLPGYRPGRAPLARLRARFGRKVRDAVVDRLAIAVARELIAERALEPIRRPTIHVDDDQAPDAKTVAFTLLLEVAPKVELGNLEGFELRRLRPLNGDAGLEEQCELDLRRQLFDALMARYEFAVPADMVENEFRRIVRGFETEVGEAVDDELAVELRGIAGRRIRLAILLTEIGRVHGISVPREEVEALVARQAERDPGHQAEITEYYLDHPTALAELQSPQFESRVVEFLLERSRVEEVEMGDAELRAALEQR